MKLVVVEDGPERFVARFAPNLVHVALLLSITLACGVAYFRVDEDAWAFAAFGLFSALAT